MNNDGIPFDSLNFPALSTQGMNPNSTPTRNILQAGAIGQQLSIGSLPSAVGSRPGVSGFGTDDFPALSTNSVSSSGKQGSFKVAGDELFGSMPQDSSVYNVNSVDTVSKEVRFGLLGLLDVIRKTDKDLCTLALGSDLTTIGLNLNSTDCLYTTFSSPYMENSALPTPAPAAVEVSTTPAFVTPSCYLTQPPALRPEQFSKLQLETLFYMFYVLPKDLVQGLAAQELFRREWKFHQEVHVWIKVRSAQEQQQSHPGVQFIYFDLNGWDIKPFNAAAIKSLGNVDPNSINMTTALLTEEDIRINLPKGAGSASIVSANVGAGANIPGGNAGSMIPGSSFPMNLNTIGSGVNLAVK